MGNGCAGKGGEGRGDQGSRGASKIRITICICRRWVWGAIEQTPCSAAQPAFNAAGQHQTVFHAVGLEVPFARQSNGRSPLENPLRNDSPLPLLFPVFEPIAARILWPRATRKAIWGAWEMDTHRGGRPVHEKRSSGIALGKSVSPGHYTEALIASPTRPSFAKVNYFPHVN